MTSKAAQEREALLEAQSQMRALVPMGTTVHSVIKSVSASGMTRVIAFYVITGGEPRWVNMSAAGFKLHHAERGYVIKGTGMDMCFHAIYSLGSALYGNGYALTQGQNL